METDANREKEKEVLLQAICQPWKPSVSAREGSEVVRQRKMENKVRKKSGLTPIHTLQAVKDALPCHMLIVL